MGRVPRASDRGEPGPKKPRRGGPPHDERGEHEHPGGRMSKFHQPWLLLLLAQKGESYGYELIEEIGRLSSFAPVDTGAVYRHLRAMEQDGLVTSEWNTEGAGPAKRVYRLTPEGGEMLDVSALGIRHAKESMERFLTEYESIVRRQRESKT